MTLSPGTIVDGYRIERVLGSGGMGTVYLAAHPVLPRHDALKVLSAEYSQDAAFRARFIREADLAATLDHPNIVAVYNRGDTADGQLWIAMQYVPGPNADTEVLQGRMTPVRAVRIVGEVARALDYAHRRNVIHRDIKPANFLLTGDRDERVFLADFGIARALDDSVGLTSTGMLVATIAYAAPEVLSGHRADHRADIYSLGCALYRMLTGETPFARMGAAAAVMAGHLSQPPPRATDIAPGLSPAWDGVLARALAKDPAQRYQSAAELAAAAQAAVQDETTVPAHVWGAGRPSAASHHSQSPIRQVQPGAKRWRRPRWIALAVTATVLAAAGITAGVERDRLFGHPQTAVQAAAAPPVEPLMATGDYQVKPRDSSAVKAGEFAADFEAMRLATFVVGPWELQGSLTRFEPNVPQVVAKPEYAVALLKEALPGISRETLTAHGYVTGFYTGRVTPHTTAAEPAAIATNLAMLFPDAESATAAGADLIAQIPRSEGSRSLTIEGHPDTTLVAYGTGENGDVISALAVSVHWDTVFFQVINATASAGPDPDAGLKQIFSVLLTWQGQRIRGFAATPAPELPNLRRDPSGGLMGRTLTPVPGNPIPSSSFGVWEPEGWLHFEQRPVELARVFDEAGVDWVSQILATVYQVRRADLSGEVMKALVTGLFGMVKPTSQGVPGLPGAQCFQRTQAWAKAGEPLSIQQLNWHFKCFGQWDRYVFTTFSDTEDDAKQQLTAQYLLLTAS